MNADQPSASEGSGRFVRSGHDATHPALVSDPDRSALLETLNEHDRAVVCHLAITARNADDAGRSKLHQINADALTELRRRKARILADLAAVDRALTMRGALELLDEH